MQIIRKGSVEYLQVNVFGNAKFNPYLINIDQIRYIREFELTDTKDQRKAWVIMVGEKMLSTFTDLGINKNIPGDMVKIGNVEFECTIGSCLTEKFTGLLFVNHKNILYARKYIDNDKPALNGEKNYKNDTKTSSENNKIAIITVDDRVIPTNLIFVPNVVHAK